MGWSWDLPIVEGRPQSRVFHGQAWRPLTKERARRYAENKYRVLLTRAREAMAIGCTQEICPGARILSCARADYLSAFEIKEILQRRSARSGLNIGCSNDRTAHLRADKPCKLLRLLDTLDPMRSDVHPS